MKKPSNRKERIQFLCKKKGDRILDIFSYMTDREVKRYFDTIYPLVKNEPDTTINDDLVQCIRCGCEVEHHFECLCGYDRAVFSEDDWKRDIEDHDLKERICSDEEFIANGYHVKPE